MEREAIKELYINRELSLLDYSLIEELKGKEIVIFAEGYRDQFVTKQFVVGNCISMLDNAAKDFMEDENMTRKEYWEKNLSKDALEDYKSKLMLLDINGKETYVFSYGELFWCGDHGRHVYYKIVG